MPDDNRVSVLYSECTLYEVFFMSNKGTPAPFKGVRSSSFKRKEHLNLESTEKGGASIIE